MSDERGADERGADERMSDERRADERMSDERGADERLTIHGLFSSSFLYYLIIFNKWNGLKYPHLQN